MRVETRCFLRNTKNYDPFTQVLRRSRPLCVLARCGCLWALCASMCIWFSCLEAWTRVPTFVEVRSFVGCVALCTGEADGFDKPFLSADDACCKATPKGTVVTQYFVGELATDRIRAVAVLDTTALSISGSLSSCPSLCAFGSMFATSLDHGKCCPFLLCRAGQRADGDTPKVSERRLLRSWFFPGVGSSLGARNFPHRSRGWARHPGLPLRGKWTTRGGNDQERLHTGTTLLMGLLFWWDGLENLGHKHTVYQRCLPSETRNGRARF